MECTSRSALRADALAAPARTSWLCQRSALASPALRQRFALAPLFGSVLTCMHSATLRQRFALAPRSSSPQSALRAACCDPRCLLKGPLNLRSAERGCCHSDRLSSRSAIAKFAQLDDEITLVQMNLVTQQNLLGWTMKLSLYRFMMIMMMLRFLIEIKFPCHQWGWVL